MGELELQRLQKEEEENSKKDQKNLASEISQLKTMIIELKAGQKHYERKYKFSDFLEQEIEEELEIMTKKYKKCKHRLKDSIRKFKNLTEVFNQIYQEPHTSSRRKLDAFKVMVDSTAD